MGVYFATLTEDPERISGNHTETGTFSLHNIITSSRGNGFSYHEFAEDSALPTHLPHHVSSNVIFQLKVSLSICSVCVQQSGTPKLWLPFVY